jgi:hypothetical protein
MHIKSIIWTRLLSYERKISDKNKRDFEGDKIFVKKTQKTNVAK